MSQVFPMVPATGKALWVMVVIIVPILALGRADHPAPPKSGGE